MTRVWSHFFFRNKIFMIAWSNFLHTWSSMLLTTWFQWFHDSQNTGTLGIIPVNWSSPWSLYVSRKHDYMVILRQSLLLEYNLYILSPF